MIKWLYILLLLSACTVTRKATPVTREVIRLNGSESYDPDGHIVSYSWRQIAGLPVQIENPKAPITFGNFSGKGTYRFELTVTDNEGAKGKDTATVIKY